MNVDLKGKKVCKSLEIRAFVHVISAKVCVSLPGTTSKVLDSGQYFFGNHKSPNVKSEITGYLRRTLKLSHAEEFKDPLNGLKDEGADILPKSCFDPTNAFWNKLWKDHASSTHRDSMASKRKQGTGGGGGKKAKGTGGGGSATINVDKG